MCACWCSRDYTLTPTKQAIGSKAKLVNVTATCHIACDIGIGLVMFEAKEEGCNKFILIPRQGD